MESNSLISIYGYGTSNMFLLRGIYICNRYFQIYPTISHASTEFNSRWILPLLLIASPFGIRKESVAFWDMQNSCTLEGFSFATWRMAAVCGDGDSCPQLLHDHQACEGVAPHNKGSALPPSYLYPPYPLLLRARQVNPAKSSVIYNC